MLTSENWSKGFLVSDSFLGGISELDEQPGFLSYVVNHATGATETFKEFPSIDEAIVFLNSWNREPWNFESIKSCGNGNCKGGACASGSCCATSQSTSETPSVNK